MREKGIKFEAEKVNKRSFYRNKKLFKMEDIDISKILVSKKEPYGKSFRYLIGYNGDDVIRPSCIRLPQMIGYGKHFKNNNDKDSKRMSFKVSDKKLLKNYNKIWGKISNLLNKEFDSEPVYGDNDKYIQAKINLYGSKVNTNFQTKKIPKIFRRV